MKTKAREIETAFRMCERLRDAGKVATYTSFGAAFGYPAWSQLLRSLLDDVNRYGKDRGLTYAISGVVVKADTGKPGDGYYTCAWELGLSIDIPRKIIRK